MALQMPVYREISAIESKVFLGLSWRQLLAACALAVVCGGSYLLLWIVAGLPSDLCMYLIFPPGIPIAMWGWWRPRGLMPERYARYLWRHYAHRNVYLLDGPSRRFVTPARPSLKE